MGRHGKDNLFGHALEARGDIVCSHEYFEHDKGFLTAGTLTCALHLSRFDFESGEPLDPPGELPLAVYPVVVEDGGSDRTREVVRAILAESGIRPAVSVTDPAGRPVRRVRVARYRFAGQEVVALLSGQLDVGTSFGRDGVTVYEDAGGRVARREVDVLLPRAGHVTNVRTGEALGETARLRTTLTAGDALVLSLGPRREPLGLEGPGRATRGEVPVFRATASPAGRRLLRWHVLGPDGAFLPEYAQATAGEGSEAAFTLPLALDDPAGRYHVQVTDVLTGASAEETLRLE